MKRFKDKQKDFVLNVVVEREPMQLLTDWSDVIAGPVAGESPCS
jgi:hypothetical protein